MKLEKIIAGFLAALMSTLTVMSGALAANSTLGGFPGYLGNAGVLNTFIVVGKTAAAEDVAGAVDIMARLAELSYTAQSTTGGTTSGVTGTSKEHLFPSNLAGIRDDQLPLEAKTFHYSGLKQGVVNYRGTDYSYQEIVSIAPGTNNLNAPTVLTNKIGAPVNGTLRFEVDTGAPVTYKWSLTQNISSSYISNFTDASPNYDNPFTVSLLGQNFQIISTPSTSSVRMLSGNIGIANPDAGVTDPSGKYTAYVTDASDSSWATVVVKDASGNVVAGPNVINQKDTWTLSPGGTSMKILVTRAYASTATSKVSARIAFGTEVDKTYDGGSDAKFPGETEWRIGAQIITAGMLRKNDNITVTYYPTEIKYLKLGEKVAAPNGYFELSATGWNSNQFAKITFESVSGITVYADTTSSAYSTSSLNGLKVSSDVSGSITSGDSYSAVYALFNSTHSVFAYYDAPSKRNLWFASPIGAGQIGNRNFTLRYGAAGDSSYTLVIYEDAGSNISSSVVGTVGIINVSVYNDTSQGRFIRMDYTNKTAFASGTNPDIGLGASEGQADSTDVQATLWETNSNIGTLTVDDVVTDMGIVVQKAGTLTASEKVVLMVPSKVLKVITVLGKIGAATTTTGGTVNVYSPIKSGVVKLDSELASASDRGLKDLVLVGGPCKNDLVAALATAGKFPYTCANWPGRNFARIQVIDDGFATGNQVVVVAGTTAADTRTGATVLQQYDTLLAGKSGTAVEATSASAAGITDIS